MELYNYLKSLHIIFVVTWFAGLFYIVRLFVYQIEAADKPSPEKEILQNNTTLWPIVCGISSLGPRLSLLFLSPFGYYFLPI